ncbi:MAG: ACT domain-containing protein [Omnitrophica bacterium]|nr:ACT domain-containing protein [Candidatus Omnitrophota bacterium]
MKAVKGKEIVFTADNKVGELEKIARTLKEEGVNIRAISAWVFEDKAYFRLIGSDNEKVQKVLENLGSLEEKDVIIVDMPDEVGQLFLLVSVLKDNGINLNYMYGTTSESGKSAIIVFSSSNDNKALEVVTV